MSTLSRAELMEARKLAKELCEKQPWSSFYRKCLKRAQTGTLTRAQFESLRKPNERLLPKRQVKSRAKITLPKI